MRYLILFAIVETAGERVQDIKVKQRFYLFTLFTELMRVYEIVGPISN